MDEQSQSPCVVAEALIAAVLPSAAAWGIVPARRDDAARARYEDWLAEGLHAGMPCLTDYAHVKFDPSCVLPSAASLILVALPYEGAGKDSAAGGHGAHAAAETGEAGLVARVSRGRDYHKVLQTMLRRICAALQARFPDGHFRPVCDTVPLSERFYAARAGLGTVVHNCLLGNMEMGTRFVLGAVVSSSEFMVRDAGLGLAENPCTDLDVPEACPTRALVAPVRLDVSRCISWLTIEYKGLIARDLCSAIGRRVFGCDVVRTFARSTGRARSGRVARLCPTSGRGRSGASCPGHGQAGAKSGEARDNPRTAECPDAEVSALFSTANAPGAWIPLTELLALEDEREVRARFAGTALIRAGRRGLVRNAIIVWSNADTGPSRRPASGEACRARVQKLCDDPDPVVAKTARQALRARSSRMYYKMNAYPDSYDKTRFQYTYPQDQLIITFVCARVVRQCRQADTLNEMNHTGQ